MSQEKDLSALSDEEFLATMPDVLLPGEQNYNSIVEQQESFTDTDRAHVMMALRHAISRLFASEKVRTDESLLEIGAGIGYFSTLVPKKFHKNLLQTDPSQEALDAANKRDPGGHYLQLDATNMETILSSSVDRVFAMNVLNYVHEEARRQIFEEVYRVLKPGGTFYSMADLQPNENSIMPTLAREAGIPFEFADASISHRDGIVHCGVVDIRKGDKYQAALWGNVGVTYPIGNYLTVKVLKPLFEEYFRETECAVITGASRRPFLWPACLIRENSYSRLYKIVESIPSPLTKRFAKVVHSEDEIRRHRFGRLRRTEIVGIDLNKGVK